LLEDSPAYSGVGIFMRRFIWLTMIAIAVIKIPICIILFNGYVDMPEDGPPVLEIQTQRQIQQQQQSI